jgi:hypothetical protein
MNPTQQKKQVGEKPTPHFPPPTFESVPTNGKVRVTQPNAETGEILVRGSVPVAEFRNDGQAPQRPERLPAEPQPPVGTVGWVRVKWSDYLLSRRDFKAAIRRGALPPEEFDRAEEAYWAYFAHKLTREERRDLVNGSIVAIIRPVEPVWEKGEVLELNGKQSARVEAITRVLKGWRTEVVIEDFRTFYMKHIVGGSSKPRTDGHGFAAEPTDDEKERARLDGAYVQTEAQAVPEGGEVLEDKLHRRLHQEQSMRNALTQSKGRVRVSRFLLEERLNEARKKHRTSTVRHLERQLENLSRKQGKDPTEDAAA